MIITSEPMSMVNLSKRELSLIKEMADAFLADFPESSDVVALIEKVTAYYRGDFE